MREHPLIFMTSSVRTGYCAVMYCTVLYCAVLYCTAGGACGRPWWPADTWAWATPPTTWPPASSAPGRWALCLQTLGDSHCPGRARGGAGGGEVSRGRGHAAGLPPRPDHLVPGGRGGGGGRGGLHRHPGTACPVMYHVILCHVILCHVSCIMWQADLVPDLGELMRSAYLEDKPLYLLQCAMEENCLAGEVTMRSP